MKWQDKNRSTLERKAQNNLSPRDQLFCKAIKRFSINHKIHPRVFIFLNLNLQNSQKTKSSALTSSFPFLTLRSSGSLHTRWSRGSWQPLQHGSCKRTFKQKFKYFEAIERWGMLSTSASFSSKTFFLHFKLCSLLCLPGGPGGPGSPARITVHIKERNCILMWERVVLEPQKRKIIEILTTNWKNHFEADRRENKSKLWSWDCD